MPPGCQTRATHFIRGFSFAIIRFGEARGFFGIYKKSVIESFVRMRLALVVLAVVILEQNVFACGVAGVQMRR